MIKRAAISLALACGLVHAATPADWSALVDQVQPSVVNIEAYQPYPVSSRMWSLPGVHRTWLTNVFDWLRVQLDDQKAKKDPEARKAEGAGFFIESSGVILKAALESGKDDPEAFAAVEIIPGFGFAWDDKAKVLRGSVKASELPESDSEPPGLGELGQIVEKARKRALVAPKRA